MVDAYYAVPRGDDPSYIDVLLDICRKEKVDVVLPIMSVELEKLSVSRDKFESIGTKISVSNIDGLRVANDKLKLLSYMRDREYPCAQFYSIKTLNELDEAVFKLGYPLKKVCVKATNASGSRGFRILNANTSMFDKFFNDKPSSSEMKLEEFRQILAEKNKFPELLVMEYLPGAEFTVDALADKGKVLECCCRKGLHMENSIMLDSQVVKRTDIEKLCSNIITDLNLDGNIGFDIKERANGIPIIMECNPRITAGVPVFYYAGVNLPYLCVKKILGEKLPKSKIQYGLTVKRRWQEMV